MPPSTVLDNKFVACCSPMPGGVIDTAEAERLARIFKALGDPTRVRLLSLIAATTGGEACICDLTDPVGLSQPTVSHHMKQLTDAGLISREQRGKWAYFRVDDTALDAIARIARHTARIVRIYRDLAIQTLLDAGVKRGSSRISWTRQRPEAP